MKNPSPHWQADLIVEGDLGGTNPLGDPDSWCPELWQKLHTLFDIRSMLDVGCGVGQAQAFFHSLGVTTLGIDGSARVLAHHVLREDAFLLYDLCVGPLLLPEKYDFVWCCELAEHLDEKYVNNVITTLVANCRKVLGFCAAPKGAGGHHHVNCQDPPYWIELLEKAGMKHDRELSQYGRDLTMPEQSGRSASYFQRSGNIFLWK